jgi:hypothetical protein
MAVCEVRVRDETGRGHARGGGLGLAFELVGRVAHPQPVTAVGTGHRALPLLDDMLQFVRERVLVRAARAEDDVVARGIRARPDLRGRALGGGIVVHAHVAEVGAKAGLHVLADRLVERRA